MIGKKAESVLNRAVRLAVEKDHEYFTLEHVLWSLLTDEQVQETIRACGGDPAVLMTELEAYIQKEIPKSAKKLNPTESQTESDDDAIPDHPVATMGIQRLIQRALFHVQSAGKDEIQPTDLLVALFQSKDSHALYLLSKQGITRLDVLNFISHGVRKESESGASTALTGQSTGEMSAEVLEKEKTSTSGGASFSASPFSASEDPLSMYSINLNEKAKSGKIDPIVGREKEIERMIQILCRRRKNNPLLVGDAGVGKTALAEGLALKIAQSDIPEILKSAVVYSLDMGSLLAGAKFRGDFEQRLKRVIQSLEKKSQSGQKPILFIDEIHTIIGAGAVSGGALDAANMLKPLLSQGDIKCIGSTTHQEFRNVFEKDHALARRFQKIDVVEPTLDETIQILSGLKKSFEDHHQVQYTHEALRSAAELASKHLVDRKLPDKAIDVIDEAGARARLKQLTVIGVPEIEEVIALMARIPARSVNTNQKARLKNLDRDLKLSLFGQDAAVDALTSAIRLARSGLRTGERPIGCFLFCGPTGVGKTELSKQLSHCLGVPFLRFDMSEYSEKHTVSRLIGAPPGYVGFEQAGMLTDAVLKNPHSVVLLDEIEKAHSDIWNILLQVMDNGFLTDNNGRKADFRNTILIMTSNVGSREFERKPMGIVNLETADSKSQSAKKAVENTFSPEFRNRLDAIVFFNPLDPMVVAQVVGKQLLELESLLLAKNVEIEFTPEIREWLAQKGYDRTMGARPLARLIQDKIKRPLSEEILFGKLENGGHVKVMLLENEIHFEVLPKALPSPAEIDSRRESQTVN